MHPNPSAETSKLEGPEPNARRLLMTAAVDVVEDVAVVLPDD
jgi:hypothetical protein